MVDISRRKTLKLGGVLLGSSGLGLAFVQRETEGDITVDQINIESQRDEVTIDQENPNSVTVDIQFLDIEYNNVTINGESGSFNFDVDIQASGGSSNFNQTVSEGLSVPVNSSSGGKRVDQIHDLSYDLVSQGLTLSLNEGQSVDLQVTVTITIRTNNLDVGEDSITSSDSATITISRQSSGS